MKNCEDQKGKPVMEVCPRSKSTYNYKSPLRTYNTTGLFWTNI